MAERTLTAAGLLAECEAGRTAHVENRNVPGQYVGGKPVTQDVLIHDLEVSYRGSDWWLLTLVCTDAGDPGKPVFVDTEGGKRLALKGSDEIRVRDAPNPRAAKR